MSELKSTKSKDALNIILDRLKRDQNGIPTAFKRMGNILPVWDIAEYIIMLGRQGEGKTSFIWNFAVEEVIIYLNNHPECKAHIYFVSLELQYFELYFKIFSSLLFKKFGRSYPRSILMSQRKDSRLSQEELDYIQTDCKPILDNIDKYVTIIDGSFTPEKIASLLSDRMDEDESEYKICITDTANALSTETGFSKHDSMKRWNQEFAMKIFRNQYNCTVIDIMQIDKASGTRQFTKTEGKTVEEKYIPTIESIAGDKEASNSASLVLAMYDPYPFKVKQVEGYDVNMFRGKIRFIYNLKSNFGAKDEVYAFIYHGEVNQWVEVTHTPKEFEENPSLLESEYRINPPKENNLEDLFGGNVSSHISRLRG